MAMLWQNTSSRFPASCCKSRKVHCIPALQRMLKEGWLKSKAGVSAKNRPIRVYSLTNAGRKHLEQELSSFEKMFAGITRVLAVVQS